MLSAMLPLDIILLEFPPCNGGKVFDCVIENSCGDSFTYQNSHGPPRVAKPKTVSPSRVATHRYPTPNHNRLAQAEHGINHAQQTTVDTAIRQWANAIIDPDTDGSMEYRHWI
jgi:hypothetical protein